MPETQGGAPSYEEILTANGVFPADSDTGDLAVYSPIDGGQIACLRSIGPSATVGLVGKSEEAFRQWRDVPAPRRGELVRLLGEELRASKIDLGRLVTLECGKILQEGLGEVQEMIDICDFATGLSRQLYGLTIASERPGHTMRECWHPLGVTGIITSFNFPVAVWAWNSALALVCGNPVIWKPSEKTSLCALAVMQIFERALGRFGDAPQGLAQLAIGGREVAEVLVEDPRIALVSATGSTAMGRAVGPRIAARFGKSILELGGNNAMIVAPSAERNMAIRAIVFSAVGTAGQRCTSLRRLLVHQDIYDDLMRRVIALYDELPVGNPLEESVLVGPLIDSRSLAAMHSALREAAAQGGRVHGGEPVMQDKFPGAAYVRPAIVEMPRQTAIVRQETFAPILYVMKYRDLDDAITIQNGVPQGLSSCIFSTDMRETERFVSAAGSDCGIANVNIGPSGAEIGGAFGGEKETGGGRESGSDVWKSYMRRQTITVNYSRDLPLAQGIKFDL